MGSSIHILQHPCGIHQNDKDEHNFQVSSVLGCCPLKAAVLVYFCCSNCLFEFRVWFLVCNAVFSVLSYYAISSARKGELVALL